MIKLKNNRYGYARISTHEQTIDLQEDALLHANCDHIFIDTASGSHTKRKALEKCLAILKAGDTLVVWRLDRLSRSLQDLINIINELKKRDINFESINEKIETVSNTGTLVFHMFAALAEFERNLIRERTLAGLAAARARGKIGGRRPVLNPPQIQAVLQKIYISKIPVSKIAQEFNVSRATIYNIKKAYLLNSVAL